MELSDPWLEPWLAAHLPPMAADALTQPETRPRATPLGDGPIVNLRGVNLNPGAVAEDMVSIRLWVAADLVVSVRIRRLFWVDELRRAAEAGRAPAGPGDFLAALAEALTDRIESISLALEDATDTLEETILDRDETEGCDALAPLRRKMIRLRRFVGPQREALSRLAERPAPPIGAEALALLAKARTARPARWKSSTQWRPG